MTLTPSQQADAHRRIAAAMDSGCPAELAWVDDRGVHITANAIAAARWREVYGDTLGDYPLSVLAVNVIDPCLGRCTCPFPESCSDAAVRS